MAELPAALYLIFIGLFVPLLALAVFGYRISLGYFAVRNAASMAARAQTYASATTAATTAWNTDTAAWNGIAAVGTPTLEIVIHQITDGSSNGKTDGTETVQTTPIPQGQVNVANNVYFYRFLATVEIEPWWNGSWFKMSIPGLTAPYNLNMHYEEVVENTQGLTVGP